MNTAADTSVIVAALLAWHNSHEAALDSLIDAQAVGLILPAPALVEAYSVIGGTARWRRGDEEWITRPPGSVIVHEAGMLHATHTVTEPTLVWVAWTTDAECEPEIVPES